MIQLLSKKTKELDTISIRKILSIKNEHWCFGMKSQQEFFEKNIQNNDLHNLLLYKSNIIGYTCLRKRNFVNKKGFFFYFDTLIIKNKYRDKGFSKILMLFNNFIIKENKLPAFLVCKKEMIAFYKKFLWNRKSNIHFVGLKNFDQCMSFNNVPKNRINSKLIVNL